MSSIPFNEIPGRGSRGPPCIPVEAYITPNEISLQPGENITCKIIIEVTTYEDPFDIWIHLDNVPQEWDYHLHKVNFPQVYSEVNTTLDISIPLDVAVGTLSSIILDGYWESGNNTGIISPGQMFVEILGPDLSVSRSDFYISDEEPKEGQIATIITRISNLGDVDATNVSVRLLWDNYTYHSEAVAKIEAGEYINYSWGTISGRGNEHFAIEVDYENQINEYNETNNRVDFTINFEHRSMLSRALEDLVICTLIGAITLLIIVWKMKKTNKAQ